MATERPDAELRRQNVERTNRLSLELVRWLLLGFVTSAAIFSASLIWWLWVNVSPGLGLMAGLVISSLWVVWCRSVEFNRVFPANEDWEPPARFRAPEPARFRRPDADADELEDDE